MKRTNKTHHPGLYGRDVCQPLELRSVYHRLFHREMDRNPAPFYATHTHGGGIGWADPEKGREIGETCALRAARALPRLLRRREWMARENRAKLSGMTQTEARACLVNAHPVSCLEWHECLPLGISPQDAANATGLSFWQGYWRGRERFDTFYAPGAKPRKHYTRAKAI